MIDATPALRAYAARRLATLDRTLDAPAQARVLASLLRRAAKTRFGRAHEFDRIRTVAGYQAAVPLRSYEAMWDDWWRADFPNLRDVSWPGAMPSFALSSGTSAGRTKHVPVSRAMMRSNRRAALDVLAHHLAERPHSRVFGGVSFMLGGSTALTRLAPGVVAGDLSGLAAARVPAWAKSRAYPPREIALMADWDRKLDCLAADLPKQDVRTISGTPSWLLLLFERIAAARGGLLADWFPRLELIVHGGVGFSPYSARFADWLEGSGAELREVYAASEGFLGVADRGPGEGMRAPLDNGLFLEFVPLADLDGPSPHRFWAANVPIGHDYALAVTSNAGLFSYLIGDVVRVVSRDPLRLLVTGRTSYFLSMFGEHLSGGEIERAVMHAGAGQGARVAEYAAGARLEGARGRHLFVVEATPALTQAAATAIDATLANGNDDWRAHRDGGQILPPVVVPAPPGTFEAWMRARGKAGGQNKVPRVISDQALFATLLSAAGQPHIEPAQNGATR